jgi:hypothetical protein
MSDDVLMREPTTLDDVLKEVRELREDGKTLRDYFAAHSGVTWEDAYMTATENGTIFRTGPEVARMLAVMRFGVADEMMKERSGDERRAAQRDSIQGH